MIVFICSRQTLDQFDDEGCDNCEDFLHLRGNRDKVFECTSANFDGMIALMDPTDSWVAKWQRLGYFIFKLFLFWPVNYYLFLIYFE